MTQAAKLEALVRRAVECGLKGPIPYANLDADTKYTFIRSEGLVEVLTAPKPISQRWLFGIFNHDFARALFGEEPCEFDSMMIVMQSPPVEWIYHLQRAVISDNPMDYMYKAVFGEDNITT